MGEMLTHWLLMLGSSVLVGTLLISLFRLRFRFGLQLFYLTLGALQYLQATLSSTVYVALLPGVLVSPGSAVLFTASLSMILLMHLREGPVPARQLLYGLAVANLAVGVVAITFGLLADGSSMLVQAQPRILLVGSAALLVDGVLLVMLYEGLARLNKPLLRIYLTLAIVLVVDSVLFIVGSFVGEADLLRKIFAASFGKLAMAPVFALMIVAYLRVDHDSNATLLTTSPRSVGDVYQFMTYREKYEAARTEMELDALTRSYSRRYFDVRLPHYLDIARTRGTPLSLLMVDVDHFKKLNDSWGHQVGDQVLKIIALAAKDAVRTGDRVCRYGGEEFAIIVIGAGPELAVTMAERIRTKVKTALTGELAKVGPLSVSIGVASCPDDAETPEILVTIADGRLYEGKAAGRDRVVSGLG